MHQNLQLHAESLELVVSTGFLQWNDSSKDLRNVIYLLLNRLHFNRDRAEFLILPSSKGKIFEYEEDMLLV